MAGEDAESKSSQEPKGAEPLHFRREVTIGGLPYIFEGDVPPEPADFAWSVSVPNWKEQKAAAEEMITKGEVYGPYVYSDLPTHHLGEGRVGFLEIDKVSPRDGVAAIGVSHVQTATDYLPEEFGYNQASGVGSFLLDNLCSLADIKSWRMYLEPMDRGGRLTQGQLNSWYRRKGFEKAFKFPEKSRDNFGDMQRWPKEPDSSQVISDILQSGS